MHILLVEPDCTISRLIERMLSEANFEGYPANCGEHALEMLAYVEYDLIILSLALSDISSYEVLTRIRRANISTPVLLLANEGQREDMLQGFRGGADDCISVPFNNDEFLARCYAVIRRSRGYAEAVIRNGGLKVDLQKKQAAIDGRPLRLTQREYQLLELMTLRKGKTLTDDAFLNALYGHLSEPGIRIFDVMISRLRKKLRDASGGRNFIKTVWGEGYVMKDDG